MFDPVSFDPMSFDPMSLMEISSFCRKRLSPEVIFLTGVFVKNERGYRLTSKTSRW